VKKKFRKTFEMVEGLCQVIPIIGLKRPYTGKDDE
jgi:hypothetical protein